MNRSVSCLLLAVLLPVFTAAAQAIQPASLESSVTRTTDKDDYYFNFKIQLPASPGDRYSISMLSSGIVNDSSVSIPINQIKLATNGDFEEVAYFDITVSDVKEPGLYKGDIRLKVMRKQDTREYAIQVRLKITNGIEIEKIGEPLVVNMTNSIGLFPVKEGQLITRYRTKSDPGVATIKDVEMILHGRTSGEIITVTATRPVVDDTLVNELTMLVTDRHLPADTYTGWLNVHVNGVQNPIRFDNVVIKVKHGWIWVVVTILAGLFLGRAITLFNSPATQSYYKFMDRVWDLKERAASVGIRDEIVERLVAVERRLRQADFDAKEVDTLLDKIEEYLIEFEVLTNQNHLSKIPVTISSMGGATKAGIEYLKKNDPDFRLAVVTAQRSLSDKEIIRNKFDNRLNRFLLLLTGLRMRSFVRSPRFRAIILLIFVLMVAGLGCTLHYLNKPDFGEQGVFDYFNILLWSSGSTALLKSFFSIQ